MAGDMIFLGNRNNIEKHLWDERSFLVIERLVDNIEPVENQYEVNVAEEVQHIHIDDNDDDDYDDVVFVDTHQIDETSFLYTPENSQTSSPLVQSNECTMSLTSPITVHGQCITTHGLVFSLFCTVVSNTSFIFKKNNELVRNQKIFTSKNTYI